jgi:predicted dehydrogenase
MRPAQRVDRRRFLGRFGALGLGTAAALAPARGDDPPPRKVRVAVIGCGSVSNSYLPNLSACPFVELVATCDIRPERAQRAAARWNIAEHYPHIDKLLAGVPFDLMVTLTDMQEHGRLNRQALEAGRNVWSEKPLANTYAEGRALLDLAKARGVRIWSAPIVVHSPQFAFMAEAIQAGTLGKPAAAHAAYGHLGPDWSAFFYEENGGSMPDLGVYNFTTLTGLLGPARSVVAMTSIITPTRKIHERGEIKVAAEDNAMVLLEHAGGAFSHVQCGFNYFDPHGHEGAGQQHATIDVVGTKGSLRLIGYDWAPDFVELATLDEPSPARHADDARGYVWQQGASLVAECLATGKEPRFTVEHALHIVEILQAARESQRTGRRVPLESTFPWPLVS